MGIKTWDELREPDERTLRFTPIGLGGRMRPEDSARYWQEVMAGLDLDPVVADGTRQSFDRLRQVLPYGLLCYDIFTLVRDHALLTIEQALRDRFIDYHQGVVTFVDNQGTAHTSTVAQYEDVHEAVRKNKNRQLQIGAGPEKIHFNGMLNGLNKWARAAGLLRGQRNRGVEAVLANLRNMVAHPTSYHLLDPVDAVRMLSDVREIINQLWAAPTPGGRLYPAPLKQSVAALAWLKDGTAAHVAAVDALRNSTEGEDQYNFAIIRGVWEFGERLSDPEILSFDSRYETTWYPAEHLWGPGTREEGITWLDANDPQPGVCDYLDRTFILRFHDGELYLPMKPSIAAALPVSEQTGQWFAVRADFPNDAFSHIRSYASGASDCAPMGPCSRCHAETLAGGTHAEVIAACGQLVATASLPPDMRMPLTDRRSWPL
ncbi:hypothetical protein ABH935_000672 [Catenulispora sp. GAS73]|uniref:hypothetical protein n=1 Tax=Catenulispora sp. GAS73 TaxID=3156269 RepID=UPI003513ECC2